MVKAVRSNSALPLIIERYLILCSSLVSVAALVTILMLAFPTFVQQSLQTQTRRISLHHIEVVNSRAVIYHEPRMQAESYNMFENTKYFESGWIAPWNQAFNMSQDDLLNLEKIQKMNGVKSKIDVKKPGEVWPLSEIIRLDAPFLAKGDPHIIQAIRSGMFQNEQSLNDINKNCPTKDCNWPIHRTLAMCTSFQDIHSQLTFINVTTKHRSNEVNKWQMNITARHLTIPDLAKRTPWQLESTGTMPDFWVTSLSYNDRFRRNTSEVALGQLPDIATIYMLYYDTCTNPLSSKDKNTNYSEPQFYREKRSWKAWKASIRLCVQSLEVSSSEGMSPCATSRNKEENHPFSQMHVYIS